jgi:hypothetical protein
MSTPSIDLYQNLLKPPILKEVFASPLSSVRTDSIKKCAEESFVDGECKIRKLTFWFGMAFHL